MEVARSYSTVLRYGIKFAKARARSSALFQYSLHQLECRAEILRRKTKQAFIHSALVGAFGRIDAAPYVCKVIINGYTRLLAHIQKLLSDILAQFNRSHEVRQRFFLPVNRHVYDSPVIVGFRKVRF